MVRKKGKDRDRERLKIDMQFQVHTADDDKLLRCGKRYGGEDAPGSSIPANRKITFKDKKISETSSLPTSPVETSTDGMDSEEGQRMSRELYRRLDQLGLSEGKSSLNPYERARRGLEVLTDKRNLARPLRVPGRGTQPTEVSEGGTTVSSKILNVPEYQEEIEIGEKGFSIHPPKLVEGPSDEGLRERAGELKYPLPQYSIYSLPDQIRRGEQPRLGGKPVGFVPYKGPTTVTGGSPRNPGSDLYLPIGGGMAITQMSAWLVPDKSPEGHSMVQVMLELWKSKYGTSFFNIDTVTGQVYMMKDNEITPIPEKCSFKPIVGTEIMSTTPIRGLGMGKLVVETPETPLEQFGTPPAAESTKKPKLKHYPANLGESFISYKDREIIESSKYTPESRADTPESDQPSALHLGPTPRNFGGRPEPSVSSPEDADELQQEERERKRMAKQLAEEAKQAQLIIEERKKAEEAFLEKERQKAQEQERAKQQAQALALQREEEARKQEQEHKLRQQEMQHLWKEKERIKHDRMSILTSHLNLLIERKKDIRKELLNKRDEQVKSIQETEEIRQARRDELQNIYREYAEQVVEPVLEYWDLDDHTPDKACVLPIEDMEDYEVTYKMGHKWSERELMNLRFNLEEVKLEPRYWEKTQEVRNMVFPQEVKETQEIYRKVKQDWEQKYATGVQWQIIAEQAILQQIDRLKLDKELQQRKAETKDKRPAVVAPPEMGKEKRPPRESHQKTPVEKEVDKTKKTGRPSKPGTPDQEQMDRERQDAVKAAANITRGVNGKSKAVKREDERSPRGTPSFKNNQGRMGTVHTPPFVPREAGHQFGPRGANGRTLPSPPCQFEKKWFCDNCQTSHGGPICPCPICDVVGHMYYSCPHRDEKESRGVVPDKNWVPPNKVCEICGTEHEGPCTLGHKQNPQIQIMRAMKQSKEWSNGNNLEGNRIKNRGPTPYCMHCGYKDNLHDPNCPIVREKAMYFQCSFCGDIGHPSDNCAARLQALQEQQQGYLCSYCGAVDHTSESCSKLKENIAREKADINRRNIEKYEASRQHTAKGQESTYQNQQEKTGSEGQPKQVPAQPPSPGESYPQPGGMGGTGGGGQPPQKPNRDKVLPSDKFDDEEDQEEEDSDRTETVSDSTSGEGIRIVKKDGTELSLKQLLKLVNKTKKRRKRCSDRKGDGGGGGDSSPSSSGGSEDDSDDSDLDIEGLRGRRGHRGQRGRIGPVGPMGPAGPVIHVPMPPSQPVAIPAKDANITISNDGMERSFRSLSDSLTQMFTQQASLNQTLHSHLTQGIQAQGDQAAALQQLALSSHQREYDRLFNAIPIYDGEHPSKCEAWIEKLEVACRTGKRDIRDVAITCAEGPVLEVINSVKADEEWPILRDEIRRCFSENKTPVHAAALLDEFPTQTANQNLRSFLYKYIKLHKMATGIQAREDFDLRQKLHFLKRLRNTRIANKIGRSAEFKDYNNFSLAMCFGRALEMEGEFQVGEKCIATEEPEVMAIDMARMTDAEICQVTQGGNIPPQGNPNTAKKWNPNPCFRCGLSGHKAADCPTRDQDKQPEIGGKIHHFLEANTPVDRDLWADFFNKCVKAQAVKKFRRYRKKFQEAVTTAQGTTVPVGTVVASPGTIAPATRTAMKKVTFAQPVVEPKTKGKGDQKGKTEPGPSKINQPTPKRKPTPKVKKEVNAIDGGADVDLGGLTPSEQEMLDSLRSTEDSGTDTVDDTAEETSEDSDSEETE